MGYVRLEVRRIVAPVTALEVDFFPSEMTDLLGASGEDDRKSVSETHA